MGSVFSVIILFSLCERISDLWGEKSRIPAAVAYVAVALFLIFSVRASLRLFLINDNGNVMTYSEEVAAFLPKILNFRPR